MHKSAAPSSEELKHWESRAPGWQIRCCKCSHAEPWGKYGVRLGGAGKSYTVGYCPSCRWLRIHVIEKRPNSQGV